MSKNDMIKSTLSEKNELKKLKKLKKNKNSKYNINKYNIVLFFTALAITLFCVTTGNYVNDGYLLEVNSISPVRFKASEEVENVTETERKRQEAASSVKEIYKFVEGVSEQVNSQLEAFFDQVSVTRIKYLTSSTMPYNIDNAIADTNFSSYLTNSQIELLLTMEQSAYNNFRIIVKDAMNALLEQGIIEGEDEKSLYTFKEELENRGLTQDMRTLGQEIGKVYMNSNQEVDTEATEKAIQDKVAEVTAVTVRKNQNIIDEGEIITEEIFLMLKALGYINSGYAGHIPSMIGINMVAIGTFVVFYMFTRAFKKKIELNKKETTLLFILYVLVIIVVRVFMNMPYLFLPISFFTFLVSVLISSRFAIFLNSLLTIICLLITKNGEIFAIYYLISGTSVAIIARKLTERNKVVILGATLSIINGVTAGALYLLLGKFDIYEMSMQMIYGVASGFLYTIICMGSLPFWEALSGVVTNIKLLDLTNPSNELLRRLTIEAPGTYHHSLIVANLAEVAAYDIGANSSLARVGGYYHDIGKLKYPQYFTENQGGVNPHDYMDPQNSASIITSHVTYGLELADKYKLPKPVKDIVVQHHGNTIIRYFFVKAKNENPKIEPLEDDFRYKNSIPQFRESAIVMLADTVEAAVRSMIAKSKDMNEVEQFVRNLIKDKFEQGQLTDSGFTIKDLDTIANSFVRVFKGMYHERIAYPAMPGKENKDEIPKKTEESKAEETETNEDKQEVKINANDEKRTEKVKEKQEEETSKKAGI